MAPNLFGTSATLYLEASQQNIHQEKSTTEKTNNQELLVEKSSNTESSYEWKIVWRNVIAFTYLHIGAIYGLYLAFTSAKYQTTIWRDIVNRWANGKEKKEKDRKLMTGILTTRISTSTQIHRRNTRNVILSLS